MIIATATKKEAQAHYWAMEALGRSTHHRSIRTVDRKRKSARKMKQWASKYQRQAGRIFCQNAKEVFGR